MMGKNVLEAASFHDDRSRILFLTAHRLGRLVLYLAAAWIAFMAGHLVAEWLDWHLLRVGPINLFAALLAAIIGLSAASLLAGPERPRRRTSKRRRKS
jgi:membrane associated rhomboid family serine protease